MKLAPALALELASLHKKYGFDSASAFVKAVRAAGHNQKVRHPLLEAVSAPALTRAFLAAAAMR